MFFIARMTAAMLIWFCGSNSTTLTRDRTDSVIGQHEREVSLGGEPVAAEIHELALPAAKDELSAATFAIGRRLVDDKAEPECAVGSRESGTRKSGDDRVSALGDVP